MPENETYASLMSFMTDCPGWHSRTEIYAAIPGVCTCEIDRWLNRLTEVGTLVKRIDTSAKNRLAWRPLWKIV